MAGLKVEIDSASLDEALEKAERLNAALREAQSLILDLAGLSTLKPLINEKLTWGNKGGDQIDYKEINTERR